MPPERLQKLLAAAGLGSRRACEELIAAGRVRVNGQVAQLGSRADPAADKITLDGEPVAAEAPIYIMLYKPRGAVSSLRPQGNRPTVRELVAVPGRLYPAGRLDVMSEGLMLMTNDGDLTNRLTHPRYGHEKEYLVLLSQQPAAEALQRWRRGLVIRDEAGRPERTRPARVDLDPARGLPRGVWLRVEMREGKKHQIRRVAQALGLGVSRIIRVRLGPLRLGQLKPGQWRHLGRDEVRSLYAATGAAARAPRRPRGR